jgi:L-arabinose isomerase
MTGEWLAYCSACPVPEIANVLSRAGVAFHQVTGVLGDQAVWAEIGEWIAAARVKKALAENRVGLLGHYYSGMLDIQTDVTQVAITYGSHIEHLEVDELSRQQYHPIHCLRISSKYNVKLPSASQLPSYAMRDQAMAYAGRQTVVV